MPGWTDEDRAWALGLALREADQCPRGHNLAESLDYDAWKWTGNEPLVCWACVAQDAAVEKTAKHPYHRAMLYAVAKHPRPKRSKRGR